ncbi:portal protein [Pseudodesulfovibrio pelocollis]|uniref:portal protein n=1 Tax=Pseudodesulfovibrio pelocollis TaxID=3051432 RepID=UPI00255B183F|nr:portal protein [Pseudodesulfovibrio sp. SB368]
MPLTDDQIKNFIERETRARADAATWRSHVQQCAEIFKPRMAMLETRGIAGDKRHMSVWNGTPEDALDVAAAGIHSETMPVDALWAEFQPGSDGEAEDKDNTLWCQEATKRVMEGFHDSNFSVQSHEAIVDLLYAGIANTYMKEGKKTPFHFSTRTPFEYVYFEDEEGEVDTAMGKVELTARQAHKKFGKSAGKPVTEALARNERDQVFEYLHVVIPREDRDASKRGVLNAPWAEYYILKSDKHLAQEKGYYEFPFLVPRGSKKLGEIAGRSQAMKALGVGNALQLMEYNTLEAGEKRVKPPLVATNAGWQEAIIGKAGAINYNSTMGGTAQPPVSEMPSGDPSWGREEIQVKEEALRRYFCVRAFEMEEVKTDVTLGERQMRKLEKVKQIAPLLHRFFYEYIRQAMMRGLAILLRRGDLREPPQGLMKLKIAMRSPLFLLLQHGADMEAIQGVYEMAAFIAEKRLSFGEVPVFDNLDDDEALRVINKRWNTPAAVLIDRSTVEETRKAKRDANAAKAQMEALGQGVDMAAKLGVQANVDTQAAQ